MDEILARPTVANKVPARPLKVSGRFVRRSWLGALALLVFSILCTWAGVWLGGGQISQIRAENRLWQTGVSAGDVQVRGSVHSRNFIFKEYKLDVDYLDASGNRHHTKAEFDLLFGSVDQNAPVEVKYDPSDFQVIALSWAMEHGVARWCSALFFLTIFGGLGAGCLWGMWTALRKLSEVRHAAVRSDEVHLDIVQIVNHTHNGRPTNTEYKCRYVVAGRELAANVTFAARKLVLFADDQRTSLVALVTPHAPERPIALEADLYPFLAK